MTTPDPLRWDCPQHGRVPCECWSSAIDAELARLSPEQPVYARLIPAPDQPTVHRTLVLDLLQDHRRVQNVRSCSARGCAWHPTPVGRNGDPDTMRRRHAQFNAHLADLIVGAVEGASSQVPSPHAHGPAALTRTPDPEVATQAGERPAPH